LARSSWSHKGRGRLLIPGNDRVTDDLYQQLCALGANFKRDRSEERE
jgi:hypothetical protein